MSPKPLKAKRMPTPPPEDSVPMKEYKTRLAEKYEKSEAAVYEKINIAVDNAAKALAIAVRELTGKGDDLTDQERKTYHHEIIKHAKAAVKQIEPNNRMHIFIFKSGTGSWWKLGGNSVAIHRMMVATYLDREVNVNVDRDSFAVFRNGVVCLQDEYRLEKDIAYSGAQLTLDDTINWGPFKGMVKGYRMKVPLEEREIRRFRKLDEEVLKNISNNIFAAAPDVEINGHIAQALRDGYQLEKQVDGNARAFVGHPLLDSFFRMRRAYYDVANNLRKSDERYEAMERLDAAVGDAMSILANYADLNIANRSAIAKVSLELAKVRELARQKINQHKRHHEVKDRLEDLAKDGDELA